MLGDRLVELRKKRDLRQQDVADHLHITRSTYAQYEINRRVPEYATLEKLADFFEVSIDYLVGRDNEKSFVGKVMEGRGSKEQSASDEAMDINDVLEEQSLRMNGKTLSEEDRKRIKDMLELMFPKDKSAD